MIRRMINKKTFFEVRNFKSAFTWLESISKCNAFKPDSISLLSRQRMGYRHSENHQVRKSLDYRVPLEYCKQLFIFDC